MENIFPLELAYPGGDTLGVSNPVMTSSPGGARGYLDYGFCTIPDYTTQYGTWAPLI